MKAFIATATLAVIAHAQVSCDVKTISTQSSYSTICTGDKQNGNNLHYWPVDVPASYCHGWEASDEGGNKQRMSSNSMKCSTDSTIFYYTLYYGVIDCGASIKPNKIEMRNFTSTCEKGDDNMYGMAVDLSCCDTKSSNFANCKKASTPIVEFPANLGNPKIYKNGELCLAAANKTTSPVTTEKKTPTTTSTPVTTVAVPVTSPTSGASTILFSTAVLIAATLAF